MIFYIHYLNFPYILYLYLYLYSVNRPGSRKAVMGKLRPAGQTRPPERFYPARDMIPTLTKEKKKS
jgi:hypothetical protein